MTSKKISEAFDPKSHADAISLGDACEQFHKALNKIATRRLGKAGKKGPRNYMIEATAQFLVVRRLAECLLDEVVTEDNQEFLRLVIDREKEVLER